EATKRFPPLGSPVPAGGTRQVARTGPLARQRPALRLARRQTHPALVAPLPKTYHGEFVCCGITPCRGRNMMRILGLCAPTIALLAGFMPAGEKGKGDTETAAGWRKYEKNPVLGGTLGTCFDISVLREDKRYRMWFSWRPKQSIALVESRDGLAWGEPRIVLGPRKTSGWEDDLN